MPLKMHQDDLPSINLTPMVDIVFQLIIFFMVGTKFTEMEKKIDLQVPTVSNAPALDDAPEQCIVNVYRDGSLELDKQLVGYDELQSRLAALRQRSPKLSVIVRGDAEGAFQNVASVLTTCRKAGIADMGISVRLASKERPIR